MVFVDRCNFGSPGDYQKKLKSVEDGVRELCDLGKRFDQCIQNRLVVFGMTLIILFLQKICPCSANKILID